MNKGLNFHCMAILSVAVEGGARAPQFPQKGAESLQKYVCVTSSTFREQYWYL